MQKRILSLVLTLLLALSLAAPALAAEPGLENFKRSTEELPAFPDVSEDAWYAAVVADARALGLMQGRADGSFDPEGGVTIAETLALACRLNDIYNGGSGAFEQGHPWYSVYVSEAISRGILQEGAPIDYLAPANRLQFAYWLGVSLPEEALEPINENVRIPDLLPDTSFGETVYRLYAAGVLTGNDEYGTFAPASGIRRCEVAAIVARMADPSQRRSLTIKTDRYSAMLQTLEETAELSFRDHPAVHTVQDGDDYYLYAAPSDTTGEIQLRLCAVPAASELDGTRVRVEVRLPRWGGVSRVTVFLEDGTESMVAYLSAQNADYSFTKDSLTMDSFWSQNPLTSSNESAMRRAMKELAEYYTRCLLQWARGRLTTLGDFGLTDLGFTG